MGILFPLVYWMFIALRLHNTKHGLFINTTLLALCLTNSTYFWVANAIIIVGIYANKLNIAQKLSYHSGSVLKCSSDYITSLGHSLAELRAGFCSEDDYRRMQFHSVRGFDRLISDVSRGAGRFRWLSSYVGLPMNLGNVLELGVGPGGWTQACHAMHTFQAYVGYSRWNQPGQEVFKFKEADDDPRIRRYGKNIEHILDSHMDDFEARVVSSPTTLLSDFGENKVVTSAITKSDEALDAYDADVQQSMKVINLCEPFIKKKPKHFIVRIPNIMNEDVVSRLENWQAILNDGRLVKCIDERNNVDVAYFVSGGRCNLRDEIDKIAGEIVWRMENCLSKDEVKDANVSGLKTYGRPVWSEISDLPVPKLDMYDMSATIKAKGRMNPPLNTTKFLKEVGWWPSKFTGSTGTQRNAIVSYFTSRLRTVMDGIGEWMTTSTKPEDTYKTVLKKVDVEPKEKHAYLLHLWEAYRALSDHLTHNGHYLHKQTEEELAAGLNRNGAIGDQECDLPYSNLGEYFDSGEWRDRVQAYKNSLFKDKPIRADFNSIGKKERKKTNSSRLIWFQCATARLYEAIVLGNIDNLVKLIPYAISGIPLYDYGETLASIFTEGKCAVADDVAGWDTKVSYSILCMECAFLKRLVKDKDHEEEIERIYRVYAHPMVTITRKVGDEVQNVLYQLRGQVASGRRVTYSMNTITNIVVTLTRAAVSQGVDKDQIYSWCREKIASGHSDSYGGKISGDDSAIIMGATEAKLFATKGADFMNEIGMPRKNIPDTVPSPLIYKLNKLEFCSHSYTEISLNGKGRWMPTRSVTEIIAKATIFVGNFRSKEQQAAWARANALSLMVNYFHMPTIRKLASGILECTPTNISLDGVSEGWSYRERPWLTKGKAVDIINKCYNDNSAFPMGRVRDITDLPHSKPGQLRPYELVHSSKMYRKWDWELPKYIKAVRQSSPRDWVCEDLVNISLEKDILSSFSEAFHWGLKS